MLYVDMVIPETGCVDLVMPGDSMRRNGDAQVTVWTCDAQDSIYRHGDAQGGCVDMVMPKTACVDLVMPPRGPHPVLSFKTQ